MELWIRSQDKEILIKVDRIGIEKFDNGYGIVTYERIGTKNEFGLGLYTTKEKALEILNEIHQRLINLQTIEIAGADYITNRMKKNGIDCVYQMPSE